MMSSIGIIAETNTDMPLSFLFDPLFNLGAIQGITWYDVGLCILGLLVILIYTKKGSVQIFLDNLDVVLGLVGGYMLSGMCFGFVWRALGCEAIAGSMLDSVLAGVEDGLIVSMDSVYAKFPLLHLIIPDGFELEQVVGVTGSTARDVLYPYVETVFAGLVRFGLLVLITVAFMALASALSPVLSAVVRKLPIVGTLDSLLGGVLGVIPATFFIMLFSLVPLLFVGLDANLPAMVLKAKIPYFLFNLFFGGV